MSMTYLLVPGMFYIEGSGKTFPFECAEQSDLEHSPEKDQRPLLATATGLSPPTVASCLYSPEKRPVGIPVAKCRAMQALYVLALDAVAETTADANSYGFRPGRSTADAIPTNCATRLPKSEGLT